MIASGVWLNSFCASPVSVVFQVVFVLLSTKHLCGWLLVCRFQPLVRWSPTSSGRCSAVGLWEVGAAGSHLNLNPAIFRECRWQFCKSDVWSTSPVSLYPSSRLRMRACSWLRLKCMFGVFIENLARLWNVNSSCWPCWNNGRQLECKFEIFLNPNPSRSQPNLMSIFFGGHKAERSMGRPLVLFITSSQECLHMAMNMWGLADKSFTAEFGEICCCSFSSYTTWLFSPWPWNVQMWCHQGASEFSLFSRWPPNHLACGSVHVILGFFLRLHGFFWNTAVFFGW